MTLTQKRKFDRYIGGFLIVLFRFPTIALGTLLRRDHSLTPTQKIAFLKVVGGGSLVIALPALLAIRRKFPKCRLVLITTPALIPFGRSLGVFDEFIMIDDQSIFRLLMSGMRAWLHCFRVDILIDLEVYSRLSTVFALLTMARNRIGFYLEDFSWRTFINTHLLYFNRFSGIYFFYDQIATLLDCPLLSIEECRAHLESQNSLPMPLTEKIRKRLVIGTGCSEYGQERKLNLRQWEILFKKRATSLDPGEVIFLGTMSDEPLARDIAASVQSLLPSASFKNLCGQKTLIESLHYLREADAYWGIDSSLLHYARLFGVPCLSIWGPTDPATRLRPISYLKEEVIYQKIPCSPCIHVAESAPCRGDNRCIQILFDSNISVDGKNALFTSWPKSQ